MPFYVSKQAYMHDLKAQYISYKNCGYFWRGYVTNIMRASAHFQQFYVKHNKLMTRSTWNTRDSGRSCMNSYVVTWNTPNLLRETPDSTKSMPELVNFSCYRVGGKRGKNWEREALTKRKAGRKREEEKKQPWRPFFSPSASCNHMI